MQPGQQARREHDIEIEAFVVGHGRLPSEETQSLPFHGTSRRSGLEDARAKAAITIRPTKATSVEADMIM